MNRRLVGSAALALALACEKPLVQPGLDQYVCFADGGGCTLPDAPGVISGTVVYAGPARGDAVLLLFDTASLPPPDGNGSSAVAVARVPAATLFANAAAGSLGPFGAPYVFTQVPAGRSYQIRAFIDAAHEFVPFFDFAQSPRAGDPAGGYGAIGADGEPHLLAVRVDAGQSVTGINVALTRTLKLDPPSFAFKGAPPVLDQAMDRPQIIQLQTERLAVQGASFANAHFGVELDRDASGSRRSTAGDGLDDVFPKVFLRQLTRFDEKGAEVAVAAEETAIIPGRAIAVPVLPLILAQPVGADAVATDTLSVVIEPFAVRASNINQQLAVIPRGRYQVVVVERTGQVWTLPNSLGDDQNLGTPYYAADQHQSVLVDNKQLAALPDGSVSGTIVYQGDPSISSGNIIVQAYRDNPLNPPPPLGAAQPERVQILRARSAAIVPTPSGFTANYRIDGLTAGQNYFIEALADVQGTFSPIGLLSTPVKGDLVGAVVDGFGNPASIAVGHGVLANQTVVMAPSRLPIDPPIFQIDDAAGPATIAADAVAPARFGVTAAPLPFPLALGSAPLFTVTLVRDAAGNTVDADHDGLPDVWPRAYLVRLDAADPQDLTQQRDPADPSRVLTQVLPAAVDPTPFLAALKPQVPNSGATVPATKLTILVRPAALDATDRTKPPQRLGPGLQPGRYRIVLVNKTGEAWQIPNEAGPAALDPRAICAAAAASCAPGTVKSQSQGRAFVVTPPAGTPSGISISGALTVASGPDFAGAYVFAYSAANPPPPLGTGTPVSADYHSFIDFSGSPSARSVNFTLPNLTAGNYLITAVVDTRGDFAAAPQLFAAAPGEGTLVATPVLQTVTTASLSGVQLTASGAQALPPRPSFTLRNPDSSAVTSDLTTLFPDALTPQRLSLHATAVLSPISAKPEPTAPFFPISYQGCDASGAPVDRDFDNLPDLYPRILVVKLSDADPSGLAIDPATTIIPAAIDPTPYVAQLGSCGAQKTIPTTDLSVILSPLAVQPSADGRLQQIAIPKGRYGVVLMSRTGQTWRIPNELQPSLLDPQAAAAAPWLVSQRVGIAVAAQVPAAQGGAISGVIHLSGYSAAQVGNLVVVAYSSWAPPPPLGLGRPLAVQVIPRPLVAALAGGGAVPYALANLGAGSYFVAAILDPLNKFSPLLSFMATPPQGAQLGWASGASPSAIAVGSAAVAGKDIYLARLQQAVPFEPPAFSLGSQGYQLSASSNNPIAVSLVAGTPVGIPYPVAAAAQGGGGLFHPTVALDASGTPVRDANGAACSPGGQRPFVSSKVYVTPIDTGSSLVPLVQLDSCQFCAALTGTANCSGGPVSPTPMSTIQIVVTSTAIDPATKQPAGVPLPQGRYAVTVVEQTGQTWTVPNELGFGNSAQPQGAVITVGP